MSQELLNRADKLRAHFKTLESVPGSGFHDNDRSAVNGREHTFVAPQKNGLPRASEHLVPFYDHDDREEVHFVGPDAEKALAALQSWLAKNGKRNVASMTGTDRKLVLTIIPKLALVTVDSLPRLTLRLSQWNDVVHALHAEGIGLSGRSLVHNPDEGV